jgi:hypothetical protein
MKMPINLYNEMLDIIKSSGFNPAEYRASLIPSYKGKDIDMRIRWDMLYNIIGSKWVCDNIYPLNMDDKHIDTALRKIMKSL